MTYGWLPEFDQRTMDKTLSLVLELFPDGVINTTELGVRDGKTSIGIHNFFTESKRINFHVGIDNGRDMPIKEPFPGCHIIIGNSCEVYNQIADSSQNFLFIDANHSYPMTVIDFWCYCRKVKINGLIALHDTGEQVKPFTDYQGMGNKEDPDFYISCRKAASDLGLLNDRSFVNGCTFQKVLDQYDPNFHTGGMLVLKRIM